MHRGFLRAGAVLGLLAVMAAASGCVGLYTLSRAVERPDVAAEGVGLPLSAPATSTPVPMTATVPDPVYGRDGLPFDPHAIDPLPVPSSSERDTSPDTPRMSPNTTPAWTPMETEAPLIDEPPPEDGLLPPALPATPR